METPTTSLGAVIARHRRTLTYRVIAVIIAAFVLPLLWAVWVNGPEVVAGCIAAAFLGAVGLLFHAQGRERLLVCQDGIQLRRTREIWSLRWSDLIGIFAVLHGNDLAKVSLKDRSGQVRVFDLNWRDRPQLEAVVWELLRRYPAIPQPLYTPWGLGFRLGDILRRLFRGNGAA